MLTERQNKILKLIVERYVKEPIPVGSKVISKLINCSSATVRNEMGELAKLGLLEKTHTSSGRVPSENGYRYYVDNLMTKYELGHEEQERIKIWLQGYSGEPDQLLEKAGSILSELTNCVAVSSAPSDSEALIKRVELVPLSSKTAMVVL